MIDEEEKLDEEEYLSWGSRENPNYADIAHDEFMIRGGAEMMHREIIDISKSDLNIQDMGKLKNYVWKGNFLIPEEKIGEENVSI